MKIGFIGCGNMATAMINGILGHKIVAADEIIGADLSADSLEKMEKDLGIRVTTDNRKAAGEAEVLFLSVKPQFYETVIGEIRDVVKATQLIITIAPGKTLEWLDKQFGKAVKIVRTMPNTPALVGEGITAACCNENVTKEELNRAVGILQGFGRCELVPEHLMDVVTSVSGSSPAYVFMFIEAMADAAVADGMPRAQAYEFAAQAVLGSAKMVLETGKHPAELKDMVCSPGGTTIEAVRVLEERGLRSAVFEAMKACTKKAKGL
ncbi:MAG: pyrroline-5-carboxylate reductase [Bacteroidales bacterium]|nr:pyrroline-5-carboxylate reductase [Clostridium sp.]MCM1203211.1 pyrroline-5-carboxylate reductase [Bacteroidales bacterium]